MRQGLTNGTLARIGAAEPVTNIPTVAEIYDAHAAFVWRALQALGVPEDGMDDALQDVFLVVHRRIASFEQRSSLRTWLYGILLRVAHKHRNRYARMLGRHAVLEDAAASATAPDADPIDALSERQAADVLMQLLTEIDDDKRAVFVMAELDGLTAPEIATATGLNLNTVYARLSAARKSFEKALKRFHARQDRQAT